MTIILNDFKPTDGRINVVFPDGFRTTLPNAQTLTLGQLRALTEGNFDSLYAIAPKKAHAHLDALYAPQLTQLVEGWIKESGTTPKE
jgi:hypothetical protein|nr:MAG TPA: hypothetical protein [Caudoviricetes sp.]DAM40421.1 MAG TPA: hypothetical protein [Caudoviricetes sp.]